MTDRRILYAAGFLRCVGTGLVGVLLGIHMARLDFDPASLGIVASSGLAGATLATFLVTAGGARIGRRRTLQLLALIAGSGGLVVALAPDPLWIAAGAFVGMLSAGRDRGAPTIVEQALLPATVSDRERTKTFTRYSLVQDCGTTLGALLAAVIAPRIGLVVYAALMGTPFFLYLLLSPAVEAASPEAPITRLTPRTRSIVAKLSALFAVDAFGSALFSGALFAYFLFERFGVAEGVIGPLTAAARIANMISYFLAEKIAARIGLINTMVWTHVPSSLILVGVAFAPTFPVAAALYLLRELFVEMDVPTRASYVMAVVRPEERTAAGGATLLARMGAAAIAPSVGGAAMAGALAAPLVAGAALKIAYDLTLWRAFRRVRPPEESS